MFRLIFLTLFIPVAMFGSSLPRPQVFIANQGQWPASVLYGAASNDVSVWITRTGMILDQFGRDATGTQQHHAVTLNVIGASGTPVLDVRTSTSSPVITMQKAGLSSSVLQTATSVIVRNVRPGIHLEYVWENGAVRYNVLVDPGTQLPSPLFTVTGASDLSASADGFTYTTTLGSIAMSGLAAYAITPDQQRSVKPLARGF